MRDGPRDEAHQAEWDAKSLASTDMLGTKSEMMSTISQPRNQAYLEYPTPDGTPSAFNSNVNLPMDNPSTDELLAQPERSDTYRGRGQRTGGRAYHRAAQSDALPLLNYTQAMDGADEVPYPPSAYTQPPIGYTPPTLRRTATGTSSDSEDPRARGTRWDEGDSAQRGYSGQVAGYADPFDAQTPGAGYEAARGGEYLQPYGGSGRGQDPSQRYGQRGG